LVNAGIYTVNYTVEDTNNYTGDTETVTVIISEKKISTSVTLIAPVSNETPQTTIETEEYTATVTWSPTVTEKFDYGTVYTATITITPKVNYTVTVVDEAGNPIAGALVQLCNESCFPSATGDDGVAKFALDEANYKVSFLTLPAGYTYSGEEQEFYFEAGSVELTITLKPEA